MPLYEYRCEHCGARFEVRLSMSEAASRKVTCPVCGSGNTRKNYSASFFRSSGCGPSTGGFG